MVKRLAGVILLFLAASGLGAAIMSFAPAFINSTPFNIRLGQGDEITFVSEDQKIIGTWTLTEFRQARSRYPVRQPFLPFGLLYLALAAGFAVVARRFLHEAWRLWAGIASLVASVGLLSLRAWYIAPKGNETVSDNPAAILIKNLWLKETSFIFFLPAIIMLVLGAILIATTFFSRRRKADVRATSDPERLQETDRLIDALEKKDSDELLALLSAKDQMEYNPEAYRAIEVILRRRGHLS